MVLYSLYFAWGTKGVWTIELFKTTIGLNSGGSSPGAVGYSLLVDAKWLVCYFLYMVLGASILISLMFLFADKQKIKKNKDVFFFLACISMMLCYVAARHSSLVAYNEGYKMCKLLGRYVAYFIPLCVIAFFPIMNPTLQKRRIPIATCVAGVTIFLPYFVLYRSMIWDYEPDWLDYARGWENIGFLHLQEKLCIIYCVVLVAAIYLISKRYIKSAVVLVCACMSIHAVVAVTTAVDSTPYMSECKEIHDFIEAQGQQDVGVVCNDVDKYNNMFGLNMYFSSNEQEWNRRNINGVYYPAAPRGIKQELDYYYMLYRQDADLSLFEEENACYYSAHNTKYIFLKMEEEIFSSVEPDMTVERHDEGLEFEFTASKDCIMCFENGFWSIENVDEFTRKIDIKYTFKEGEKYDFTIYDFGKLEKFTYSLIW